MDKGVFCSPVKREKVFNIIPPQVFIRLGEEWQKSGLYYTMYAGVIVKSTEIGYFLKVLYVSEKRSTIQ